MLKIGTRKIQKIRGSHYLNLPKIWTENNHTKKGDPVDIELQDDGSLNIKVAPLPDGNHESGAASTGEYQHVKTQPASS